METNTQTKTVSAPVKKNRSVWIFTGIIVILIVTVAGILIYNFLEHARVYVDSASIEAPLISLAPQSAGVLQQVFVNEGDEVPANTPVAQVGNELVKTTSAGIIVQLPDQIGAQVAPGEAIAQMIDPLELRVVGKVDEDKGLSRIAVGDAVSFTVDAFGGKKYSAIVDEVSPTSAQSGIVFNISDQREVQQLDVKARFDTTAYSELKNGMSARMWIYTQ